MNDLYIIGAGGLGREVLWLARQLNDVQPRYKISGFVDDNVSLHGTTVCDVPVIGAVETLRKKPGSAVALGIGLPHMKRKIIPQLASLDLDWPTLIAPSVEMSAYVQVGRGTIICAKSILTTQVTVGDFVLINLGCTIGHDAELGTGCTLSPGVNLSGYVSVGEFTDVGTGSKVIPGVKIGHNAVVGAGAVIIRDVPDNATVVGNPGRVIKLNDT